MNIPGAKIGALQIGPRCRMDIFSKRALKILIEIH
jgi:hypothetical protein